MGSEAVSVIGDEVSGRTCTDWSSATGGFWATKLPLWRKTTESSAESRVSAIASLRWFVALGVTEAEHVSSVVNPSGAASIGGGDRSLGSLLRKRPG